MNGGRLHCMFDSLRGRRAALISYATAFCPDREGSLETFRSMLASGADALEVGIPFSDPVMDGPVIQAAGARALTSGATVPGVLDLVSGLRAQTDKPLLAMTYYNPVLRYGVDRFAADAAAAGLDGLIVPDLPLEEMGPLATACASSGLATVAFCALTTSEERMEQAATLSTGFLYCISLLGTTGPRESMPVELPGFLDRVRGNARCPLAVGLGISTPAHCASVGALADGVIVGSALMRKVLEGDNAGMSVLLRSMAGALREGGGRQRPGPGV